MLNRKIIIVNDGLGPNKGDQAILQAMLHDIRNRMPNLDVVIFPNSHLRSIRLYRQYWINLRQADLLVFGGGQELQDHVSLAFLISGLLKIILARLQHRKIMCYALGVGPVATRLGKLLLRLILNRVDIITLRDEDSLILLRTLKVEKPPIHVTADPAITLLAADNHRIREINGIEGIGDKHHPKIAVAPRRWFHYNHYLLPMSLHARFHHLRGREDFSKLIKILAEIADYLINTLQSQIVFVPMRAASTGKDPGQDDDLVSQEIIDAMHYKENAILLRGNYNPGELKGLLGKMDMVIGMRMHALIMASMMKVPVIGLNISPKFPAFLRMIGQEKYLIEPEGLSRSKFISTVNQLWKEREEIRAALATRCEILQYLALHNCEYLSQLLNN
ncbi:MAG: polysaccharide pyruvyl transferase family protein [Candidatus Cloacimonetes bacterium]|nr:polysaccharide pyruvyl transferase family protein [Candidatus Cloacimonadota bacterium]